MHEKKCRTCLSERADELLPLFSINNYINSSLTNAELIMACSSVKITQNDEFPQNICGACYNKLSQSYEFKLLCENSDKILRSFLKHEEVQIDDVEYFEDSLNNVDESFTVEDTTDEDENSNITNVKIDSKEAKKDSNNLSTCISVNKEKNSVTNLSKLEPGSPERIILSNNIPLRIRYACSRCKKQFNTKDELRIHFEQVHPEIRPAILEDGDKVNNAIKKALENFQPQHKTVHRKKSKKKKEHSPKKKTDKIDSKENGQEETPEKVSVYCILCNESCENVKKHFKHIHQKKDCSKCGKQLISFLRFSRHMEGRCLEKSKRTFLCSYCGLVTECDSFFARHMKIHTGEKPYKCDICGKTFRVSTTLVGHRTTHTGEKNYACEICGRKFARKNWLSKHMPVHSDERKYSCHICAKTFKYKKSVKLHMAVHGISNFKCKECGKEFKYRKNLKDHRQIHTASAANSQVESENNQVNQITTSAPIQIYSNNLIEQFKSTDLFL